MELVVDLESNNPLNLLSSSIPFSQERYASLQDLSRLTSYTCDTLYLEYRRRKVLLNLLLFNDLLDHKVKNVCAFEAIAHWRYIYNMFLLTNVNFLIAGTAGFGSRVHVKF